MRRSEREPLSRREKISREYGEQSIFDGFVALTPEAYNSLRQEFHLKSVAQRYIADRKLYAKQP